MTRLAVVRRSFPTFMLLLAPIRWVGQNRRRTCRLALSTLAVVGAMASWWKLQLVGLPDIGDPFDVAEFRLFTIPDDRNAFLLYEQAAALLKPSSKYLAKVRGKVDRDAPWSKAVPELRGWTDDNREALAVFRQASDRPDALDRTARPHRDRMMSIFTRWSFCELVLLEASRLEEQGDMAGAWGWYRALLRTVHHVGMHGSFETRTAVDQWHAPLIERLTIWSEDAKTCPALLRQALDDVVACLAQPPGQVDALKTEYLNAMTLLDSGFNPGRRVPWERFRRFWIPDYRFAPEQVQSLWDAWRFWRGEPERSRRLIQLITANWLAYYELPPESRPHLDRHGASIDLYPLGPSSPANARILDPETLQVWFDSTYDAQKMRDFLNVDAVRSSQRTNRGKLLMLFASELYHRDHGTYPLTDEALVGPYLTSLPD